MDSTPTSVYANPNSMLNCLLPSNKPTHTQLSYRWMEFVMNFIIIQHIVRGSISQAGASQTVIHSDNTCVLSPLYLASFLSARAHFTTPFTMTFQKF